MFVSVRLPGTTTPLSARLSGMPSERDWQMQGWLRIRLDDGQIGLVYSRWPVEAAELGISARCAHIFCRNLSKTINS